MRLCLVTPYDLSYDGGVNRHVISLAQALRRQGDRVRVLGPASGAVPPGCFGLSGVVPVNANGSVARVGLLVRARAVRRYLQAGRFDAIHVHEPWLPGIAHHAVRSGVAPVLGTFHTYADTQTLAVRMARRVLGRRLRRMDAAIAVSTAAAEFARTVFRGPTYLVPNGVDTGCFTRGAPWLPLAHTADVVAHHRDATPARVLFVGRFDEPRKGLSHLLEAAALVRAAGRKLEVHVAGVGANLPPATLTRAANARFLGRLDDAALVQAYQEADVLCAPAIHGESFGLVLIEAMACGCPVVASDIRGYREAADGAATLVEPGNAEALARALATVTEDRALRRRLIARGHRRADALSWDRLVHDVRALYELLAPVPRRAGLMGATA